VAVGLLNWSSTYQPYISKDINSQPREFEEHQYFCSLARIIHDGSWRARLPGRWVNRVQVCRNGVSALEAEVS
jgi:hypothetical protein